MGLACLEVQLFIRSAELARCPWTRCPALVRRTAGQQHCCWPLAEILPEECGRAAFVSLGSSLHFCCFKSRGSWEMQAGAGLGTQMWLETRSVLWLQAVTGLPYEAGLG